MIAIADAIGGDWPERARRAALALSGGRREESAGIELLADIKAIFDAQAGRRSDKLTSKEIVEALVAMEDRPWPEWSTRQAAHHPPAGPAARAVQDQAEDDPHRHTARPEGLRPRRLCRRLRSLRLPTPPFSSRHTATSAESRHFRAHFIRNSRERCGG